MILASSIPCQIGRVYRSGQPDAPTAIVDGDLNQRYEFCFQVLREASRDEYCNYWKDALRLPDYVAPPTASYFYEVSMD